MKYYRVLNDLHIEDRWFLGEVNFDDEWDFWQYVSPGVALVPDKELVVSVTEEGKSLDFNMADFELLIINEKVASLLNKEEVQLIPIKVDKLKSKVPYFLMVVKNAIDCVDEEKSQFMKWEPGNKIRPDKVGEYENFMKLVINPSKVGSTNIFRIKGFDVAVIISQSLKESLEKNNIKGVRFKEVS
jgi:hypothetical protein